MSPQAFRNECRALKREHYVLTKELHEVVDPRDRQRLARAIANTEVSLMDRGVSL